VATSEEVVAVTRRKIWINHHKGAIIVEVLLRKVKDGQQAILLELIPLWNRRWRSRYRWDMEAFRKIHDDQIHRFLYALFIDEVPIFIANVLKITIHIKSVNFEK